MSRLGLIVPSTNTVSEMDFQQFSPDDVGVHTSRMYIEETTAEDERRMVTEYLPPAVRDLATMRPDVVVFSCTSAGAVIGEDGEAKLIEENQRLKDQLRAATDKKARMEELRSLLKADESAPAVEEKEKKNEE